MTNARDYVQFGPYLVARVSGAGAMGRVELALRVDAPDQEFCVIKRLHGALHDEAQEAQVRREARIASRLEHVNIARTRQIEKIDGQLCIAQEFVEGVTLAKLMRQLGARPLPLAVALHVVSEVARGLGYAHAFGRLGILHRDVRPENVMLSFCGEVKLIDFGIPRSAVGQTVTDPGVVVGRRSYKPPEAFEGAPADCRGDVYALGVVLWEVLTGHRMEEAADPQLWDLRELNPEISPLLGQIVERAIASEPDARFRSADALSAELAGFVPPDAEPRGALVELLATCFNVPLQQSVVKEEVAEARRFLQGRAEPSVSVAAPAAEGTVRTASATVAVRRPPARRPSAGPWLAATTAAILATSAVGLLRTHGRSARARASAETLATARPPVPPPPSTMAGLIALASSPQAPAPPGQESSPAADQRAPSVAPAERPEAPPPGAGRAPETGARPALPTQAGQLLRRANARWERGDSAGAYTLARQALGAGAGAPAHVLLGALLINMNEYPAAEPELRAAIALDPRNGEARRMLALLRRTSAERIAADAPARRTGAPFTRPGP